MKKTILSKAAAVALGALICSNVAIMGVHAKTPDFYFVLGYVDGDGVALRRAASTSSDRLELMYKNEDVFIDYDYNNHGGWSHVQRYKTGTVGYSVSTYIKEYM